MSERRPDPPDPRASLVDSGWSEPAAVPERELPEYEDTAREHLVTRVDDQIQARIAAMNIDDRTDATTEATTAPSILLTPPPAPPPPLPLPMPAPSRPSRPPLPPSARRPSVPPPPSLPVPSVPLPVPSAPLPELTTAPTDERTLVDSAPPHPAPGPPPAPSRPASLPPPVLPPLGAPPTFAPMPSVPPAAAFVPPPTLPQVLLDRVRIGAAELPLWGVLAPALVVTALLSALIAGLLTSSGPVSQSPSSAVAAEGAHPESAPAATAAPSDSDSKREPASGSLVDLARGGDANALATLERRKPEQRVAEEALALSAGKVAQALGTVGKLRARLAADPGLAKDPKIVADLRRMAQDPATSRDALGAMAALPGSLSADLLYEAWTSTAERSEITELAQALLLSRDVRPKASPALAIALDLREAETCEANLKILPRVIEVGDKRAFAPLSRLLRHNGCGPTKRDDCYPCIRDGELLKKALTTVKLRREPEAVRRDTPTR